jgi:hypothetical protein
VTTTDEILDLAAFAGRPRSAAGASAGTASIDSAVEVTEADLAAFREAAARGAGSDVVRALRAVRPGPPSAVSATAPSGDPAWTAWLTASAATAAASEATANPVHTAWLAVFAVGTALSGRAEVRRGHRRVRAAGRQGGVQRCRGRPLARSGFTAPGEPLDGRRGLFTLFGRICL